MFKRYTKWKQLGSFSFSSKDYIIFARINLKSGMMQFKQKVVNSNFFIGDCCNRIIPSDLIDIKKAWKELIENAN